MALSLTNYKIAGEMKANKEILVHKLGGLIRFGFGLLALVWKLSFEGICLIGENWSIENFKLNWNQLSFNQENSPKEDFYTKNIRTVSSKF